MHKKKGNRSSCLMYRRWRHFLREKYIRLQGGISQNFQHCGYVNMQLFSVVSFSSSLLNIFRSASSSSFCSAFFAPVRYIATFLKVLRHCIMIANFSFDKLRKSRFSSLTLNNMSSSLRYAHLACLPAGNCTYCIYSSEKTRSMSARAF